jgi:hypothetical protein
MAEGPARRPFLGSVAIRVLAWFAALFAVLYIVRDQLGPVLTLIAGVIVFSCGIGFVIAPLARRHAGTDSARDHHLFHNRWFVIGLVVSVLGLALSVYGVYRIVQHAVAKSHSGAISLSAPDARARIPT